MLPQGRQRLNQLEDKIDRRFSKHDDRLAVLEDKVDFFVQTPPPLQGVFYEGQLWDACSQGRCLGCATVPSHRFLRCRQTR